jgi:hypothetical protein
METMQEVEERQATNSGMLHFPDCKLLNFHFTTSDFINNLLPQIYYLDNLMVQNGLDPFHTPRCSVFTTDIIRTMQNVDHRKSGSNATRYGGAKVSTYKLQTITLGHMHKLVCSLHTVLILHIGFYTWV